MKGTLNMNETLFNHNDIYTLLYHGDIQGAVSLFKTKTDINAHTPTSRNIYLSSLNIGIYNYILVKENVSLHDCCYENEKKIATVTKDTLFQAGADIIISYGMDKRYMIEKYTNCHIKNAMYYIHSHIGEPLTLTDVCEHVCVTPSYLCQLFKREVHMSFCDYVMSHRLKVAKGLLNSTDYPIEEIAQKCGFKNGAYFSTCYKKMYGFPPSKERMKAS